MNSLVDNPCVTLPISQNWIAEYNNLRCKRVYTTDSGFLYNYKGLNGGNFAVQDGNISGTEFFWNSNWNERACRLSHGATACTTGNTTYIRGKLIYSNTGSEVQTVNYYEIKRIDTITEYKLFSQF